VLGAGGNPDSLLGRQQVAAGRCFDLGHSLEGVFELVKIMAVPASDELCTNLEGVVPARADEVPRTS
jgi:hypothetical protein